MFPKLKPTDLSEVTDPRQELGAQAENAAAEYLRRQGFIILNRNYRTKRGEVDIIALDGDCLTFIEVKSESQISKINPLMRVNERKRRRIGLAAQEFTANMRLNVNQVRFDAISMSRRREGEWKIEHIRDAFQIEI